MDGLLYAYGAAQLLRRRLGAEWFGTAAHLTLPGKRKPQGLAAHPHDLRPTNVEHGRQIIEGVFALGGATLRVGPTGDPFDRPSPTRRFAAELHRFDWMSDLLAAGAPGVRPGVRLYMDWRRLFGRWNAFAWSAEIIERRVFNLACAAKALTSEASEAEIDALLGDLDRQARHLLVIVEDPSRACERAAVAAIAGCALGGKAGDALVGRALRRLNRKLRKAALPDGGHATRSPQRGLELLFDLLTLDDALSQRARPTPEPVTAAIDRLGLATRFFTLADGRLAAFQGGAAVEAATIAAALAHEEPRKAPLALVDANYHRLAGVSIEVLADAGRPARGGWSLSACAQPLALEVVCGRDRLITGSGWTAEAQAPAALRIAAAASTASLGDTSCGEPVRGFLASGLGEQLIGGPKRVEARRHETEKAMWLEATHDGWVPRFGLIHERRLFLDRASGELRGEDRFEPTQPKEDDAARRYIPFAVHFHVPPDVDVSLAQDGKTAILRGRSNEGRWLRTDAAQVAIEQSAQVVEGAMRRASQVVLRGQVLAHKGGRVRWKLSPSES